MIGYIIQVVLTEYNPSKQNKLDNIFQEITRNQEAPNFPSELK